MVLCLALVAESVLLVRGNDAWFRTIVGDDLYRLIHRYAALGIVVGTCGLLCGVALILW